MAHSSKSTQSSSSSAKNARAFISPSDLTFAWDGCHRCLWLKYNHGVSAPLFMPLVGELSALQEAHFDNAKTQDVAPVLPAGRVRDRGGWVKSRPIEVQSQPTPYAIRGKYDLLIDFEDGSVGIIDCKFQGRDTDKSDFYAAQLEAYAFALENPAQGDPQIVSVLGLLVWSPKNPQGSPANGYQLNLNWSWRPIERNPAALTRRLNDFIYVISGSTPERDSGCEQCRYISQRREIFGNE